MSALIRRSRLLCVLGILLVGALGVISSTQTWLVVVLDDGSQHQLPVTGAAAVPVLAPLSLAVLALGGALTIVGRVLRYAFGVLALGIAGILGRLTAEVVFVDPAAATASTVTAATGISGPSAADLVARITATPWPPLTLTSCVLLALVGALVLATAHTWGRGTRRYESDPAATPSSNASARPHDAVDSWDDLSRGTDPTTSPR